MNHTLLLWGSLAVFGALSTGRAVLSLRATTDPSLGAVATAFSAFLVLGASLFALRDPETFEPPRPWLAYVAAAGTAAFVASLLV